VSLTAQIVIGVALGLLAFWVKARGDTPSSVVQPRQSELVARLKKRIKDAGWCLALVVLSGCYSPAVYVPCGEPVRIAKTIKKAKVEIILPGGNTAKRVMDIPAGWYALPDESSP